MILKVIQREITHQRKKDTMKEDPIITIPKIKKKNKDLIKKDINAVTKEIVKEIKKT